MNDVVRPALPDAGAGAGVVSVRRVVGEETGAFAGFRSVAVAGGSGHCGSAADAVAVENGAEGSGCS